MRATKREILKETAKAKKILKEVIDLKSYMEKAGRELKVARLTSEQFRELGVSDGFKYQGIELKLDKEKAGCMNQSSLI